jgi:predicted nucleic acid-binding protein
LATYYFDTSALVKLYIEEVGSPLVLALTRKMWSDKLAVLDLARLEARAAIRKRERMGDVSAEASSELLASLDEDLSEVFLIQAISPDVVGEAIRLLDLYPLKAYDALQLAGCVVLATTVASPTLVTADRQMLAAATGESIAVIDPEASP